MQIHELTALARQMKASDIHLSRGAAPDVPGGWAADAAPVQMNADETRSLILGLMDEAHREAILTERIDADFALVAPDGTRSRVNVFSSRGGLRPRCACSTMPSPRWQSCRCRPC